ncbi:hypothetical protein O6H91_15G088100 [Diphasiastrum complanatum]|nr:hypothetical protein O6H91_15G088100 [Diphasiastrum complanatum]
MTLRSSAIRGVLRSLAEPGASMYFDPIKLSSQLGPYAVYHFMITSGSFVGQTCKDSSHFAPVDREKVYRGTAFCSIFSQFVHQNALQIHDGSGGTRLLVQDVRCIDFQATDGERFANVSAILRKVTVGEDQSLAMQRTGVDDHALVVDGVWRSSVGVLCMAGCQNPTSDTEDSEECFAKVGITIPVLISLHQQSLLLLNISDTRRRPRSSLSGLYFLPINIDGEVHPDVLKKLHYEYGKISEAEAMISWKEATGLSLTSKLGPKFLIYPSMKLGYHTLSRALSVYSSIMWIKSNQRELQSRGYLSFQPIAINDFICIDSSQSEGAPGDKDHSSHGKQVKPSEWTAYEETSNTSYIEEQDDHERMKKGDSMVKVAARLMITSGGDITPMNTISAEGVYNPKTGSMHLAGCRIDGGEDVDCRVEIVVQYPAMNVRWLINPSVNFYIRNSSDKQETQLKAAAFSFYEDIAVKQIISEKSMEGILIMTSLTLTVVCISSQLVQTRWKNPSLPFVSQVMLVVQATGYMISVTTGAEGLLSRMLHERFDQQSSQFAMEAEMEGEWTGFISYTVKLLNLVTFMLVTFLFQSVRKARVAMANNRLHDPQKPPQERRVIVIFALIHAVGFLIMLAAKYIILHRDDGSKPKMTRWQAGWEGGIANDSFWFKQMKNYAVVVQDLFLLPQVIAGFIWDMQGKPLRYLYYLGLTILRLLPHVYDLLRSSVLSSQVSHLKDEVLVNDSGVELMDHSQFSGDIPIAVLALLLVVAVFFQQTSVARRWRKAVLRSSSSKLLRFGSRISMYERLPSRAFEAELMPTQDPPTIDKKSYSDLSHDRVRA